MKKLFFCIFILLATSVVAGELTYGGFPWGTNIEFAKENLAKVCKEFSESEPAPLVQQLYCRTQVSEGIDALILYDFSMDGLYSIFILYKHAEKDPSIIKRIMNNYHVIYGDPVYSEDDYSKWQPNDGLNTDIYFDIGEKISEFRAIARNSEEALAKEQYWVKYPGTDPLDKGFSFRSLSWGTNIDHVKKVETAKCLGKEVPEDFVVRLKYSDTIVKNSCTVYYDFFNDSLYAGSYYFLFDRLFSLQFVSKQLIDMLKDKYGKPYLEGEASVEWRGGDTNVTIRIIDKRHYADQKQHEIQILYENTSMGYELREKQKQRSNDKL